MGAPTGHEPEPIGQREFTRRQVLQGAAAGGAAIAAAGALAGTASGATRGGTLRIGNAIESQPNIDGVVQFTAPEILRSMMVYDRPILVGPTFKLEYPIADAFEPNKDASQWTIRLKKGIEFHNGKTAGAEDLVYTVLRLNNPKVGANAYGSMQAPFPKLHRIKKLDSRTVRLMLDGPNSVLDWLLADGANFGLMPAGMNPKQPNGTGPFKFVSGTPGDRFTFARSANYHGQKAWVDQVVSIDIPDTTARVNALYSGQIDVVSQPTPADCRVAVTRNQELLQPRSSYQIANIQMRTDAAPFNDPRVRLAFKYCLNRQQIRTNGLAGFGTIGADVWGRYDPAYIPTLKRDYDLDRAKSLLKAAGKDGVTVDMVCRARDLAFAQVVQQNAAAMGMKINIRVTSGAVIYSPANLYGPALFVDAVQGFSFLGYVSGFLAQGAFFNRTKWNDKTFFNLLDQALKQTNANKRKVIVQKMMRIFFDRGPWVIPVFGQYLSLYSPKVTGWTKADAVGFGLGANEINKVSFTS
jgi:peptide/nickel transport system substrate-binding protein